MNGGVVGNPSTQLSFYVNKIGTTALRPHPQNSLGSLYNWARLLTWMILEGQAYSNSLSVNDGTYSGDMLRMLPLKMYPNSPQQIVGVLGATL